jgi:hypothetical protein
MSGWTSFLSGIQKHISALERSGCDTPFFRGHNDGSWKLLCGLGRQRPEAFKKSEVEGILYYDFMSLAGPLLERDASSWDILFAMQLHGLPTRLLDWTATFGVALYFAVRLYRTSEAATTKQDSLEPPCVWVLDPFQLNLATTNEASILNPQTDLTVTYQSNFIEAKKSILGDVIAINPTQLTRRQAVQRSVFTLHSDLFTPLEHLHRSSVKQFILPTAAIPDAIAFLSLSGVNEFSLFPDLDGLARHLKAQHVDWR